LQALRLPARADLLLSTENALEQSALLGGFALGIELGANI
jgi:hypothetical protein